MITPMTRPVRLERKSSRIWSIGVRRIEEHLGIVDDH
jgi:hypothetical protein